MFVVTDRAAEVLEQMLEDNGAVENEGVRILKQESGRLALGIDGERDGDQIVRKGQRPLLLVDSDISGMIDGATLDINDSPEGPSFSLKAPEGPAASANGTRPGP